jgi:hypothetical protein
MKSRMVGSTGETFGPVRANDSFWYPDPSDDAGNTPWQ